MVPESVKALVPPESSALQETRPEASVVRAPPFPRPEQLVRLERTRVPAPMVTVPSEDKVRLLVPEWRSIVPEETSNRPVPALTRTLLFVAEVSSCKEPAD